MGKQNLGLQVAGTHEKVVRKGFKDCFVVPACNEGHVYKDCSYDLRIASSFLLAMTYMQ